MRHSVDIENIEAMRLQEGIEDVELREAVRALHVGDIVRLTLLTRNTPPSAETLPVRIIRIEGKVFRGRLTSCPSAPGLSNLRAGSLVTFTRDHIHSIPKQRPPQED